MKAVLSKIINYVGDKALKVWRFVSVYSGG